MRPELQPFAELARARCAVELGALVLALDVGRAPRVDELVDLVGCAERSARRGLARVKDWSRWANLVDRPVEALVDDQVEALVDDQVEALVDDQVEALVDDQVEALVDDQVEALVDDQVDDQVEAVSLQVVLRTDESGPNGPELDDSPEARRFRAWQSAGLAEHGANGLHARFRWQGGRIVTIGRIYAELVERELPGCAVVVEHDSGPNGPDPVEPSPAPSPSPRNPPPPPPPPRDRGSDRRSGPAEREPAPAAARRDPVGRFGLDELTEAGRWLAELADGAPPADPDDQRAAASAQTWTRMLVELADAVDRAHPGDPGIGAAVALSVARAAYGQNSRSGFCWLRVARSAPRRMLTDKAFKSLGLGWGVRDRDRMPRAHSEALRSTPSPLRGRRAARAAS